MGMSILDAGDWDFVEYAKVLKVWNNRQKAETRDDEQAETHDEPPSLEWMIADDQRVNERGYRVIN